MKNHIIRLTAVLLLSVSLCMWTQAQCRADDEALLRVSGAGSLSPLAQPVLEDFSRHAEGCPYTVAGGSTGRGYTYFLAGQREMVMASRKMLPIEQKTAEEKGIGPAYYFKGHVAIAIITRADNPVDSLTMEQLGDIFSGEIFNWKQVGGPDKDIRVTTRPVPGSGTGTLFQEVALHGAPYAPGHVVVNTYRYTVLYTASETGLAIGYIPTSSGFYRDLGAQGVKVIKLKKNTGSPGFTPPEGLLAETDYPLCAPFYLVWDRNSPKACVRRFARFVAP